MLPLPFVIPAALKALPWRWIGIGVGTLAVVSIIWWRIDAYGDRRYEAGKAHVQAKWDAAQRAAEAKAAADSLALQSTFGAIDSDLTTDMEVISNVRTVYRDKVRTTAVDVYRDRAVACTLPDSLLGQINAAAASYAAAATGAGQPTVRPAPAAP